MVAETRLPITDTLSRKTLNEVRRNLGSDYVVSGSYTSLPGSQEIRIDLTLQDARSGNEVGSWSEHGPISQLFQMVARSGAALRADLRIGGVSPSEAAALKEALPSSPESAQLFAEGAEQFRRSNFVAAKDLLLRATALDPRSASVHSALAETWARLGYELRARENACKAAESTLATSRESQLLLEGRCKELSRDWPRAIEVYQSLWTFFPDEPEHGLRLVRTQIAAGRSRDAMRTLSQLRKIQSSDGYPRIDLAGAEAAEARGAFAEELTAAESAIKKASDRGARLLVAQAQLRAAWALDYLGKRTRALDLATTAKKTFVELGDKGGEAVAIKNMADVIDDGNDHLKALPIYKQALAKFQDIGSETGAIVTLNNMGYALKDMGDLDGAQNCFSDSVRRARQVGDNSREAQALNSLAGIYWRRGDLKQAEATFDTAELKFEAAGDQSRAATAIGNLGLVLKDQGSLSEAQHKTAAITRYEPPGW